MHLSRQRSAPSFTICLLPHQSPESYASMSLLVNFQKPPPASTCRTYCSLCSVPRGPDINAVCILYLHRGWLNWGYMPACGSVTSSAWFWSNVSVFCSLFCVIGKCCQMMSTRTERGGKRRNTLPLLSSGTFRSQWVWYSCSIISGKTGRHLK